MHNVFDHSKTISIYSIAEMIDFDDHLTQRIYSISVIEGTAPPPASSKHLTLPTSPHSVSSILLSARLTEQAVRGWESQMFGLSRGVLSLLSLIYCIFFDLTHRISTARREKGRKGALLPSN